MKPSINRQQIHDGDIYNNFIDDSIDVVARLNTLYNYLKNNQFYAYLYKDGKYIARHKMTVYFNRRIKGDITKENMKSFKHITFKLNLSEKDIKEIYKKTPLINTIKITMFNGIFYKGVFKTYKRNYPFNNKIKTISVINCMHIDKEGKLC